MSKERGHQARSSLRSLPLCGGGLGRGVAPHSDHPCGTPLPTMLCIVDLPHKGGGNKNGRSR
ncbi:hypothetical protein ACVIWV_004014 [Bradyrhizobium diazoefficiens]